MKIWIDQSIYKQSMDEYSNDHRLGVLISPDDNPHEGAHPLLCPYTMDAPLDGDKLDSVLVSSSDCSNAKALVKIANLGKPVYLIINGLGTEALKHSLSYLSGCDVILLYDSDMVSDIAYYEQLAWLSGQQKAFAVCSSKHERLIIAAMFNPEALIISGPAGTTVFEYLTVSELASEGAMRPINEGEVDVGLNNERSLTVVRELAANSEVKREDIVVDQTVTRGISPHLNAKVAGRILRYPIKPGEPLTFGHFK